MKPGIPFTHDLSDERQHRFVMRHHGGEDHLAQYYPHLKHLLDHGRRVAATEGPPATRTLLQLDDPPANQWIATNALAGPAPTDASLASVSATAVSSFPNGTYYTSMVVTIVDLGSGQMIAQEVLPNQFLSAYAAVTARGTLATPGNPSQGISTITTLAQGATTPLVQSVTNAGSNVCPTASPTVTGPIHQAQPPNVGYIKVALNRSSAQQPDCDYYYQTGTSGPSPIVGVQVSGSAAYAQPICPLSFGSTFFGSLVLVRRGGVSTAGGGALPFPPAQIINYVTASGNTLSWNFVPAVFGAMPWDQNQLIDVLFSLSVNATNNCTQTTNSTITVTSVQGAVPSLCVAVIDPLSFVWGCLTADTAITMEDGSRKRVAEIAIGDRVRSSGRVRTVENVVTGVEKEPCLRIRLAGGRAPLVTSQHPMITPDGVKLAGALAAGDLLLTEAGAMAIEAISEEPYPGTIYNLALSRDGGDDADTTHFADGVLVGDHRMQGVFAGVREPEEERDPAAILAALPPEAHHDFLNAERHRRGEPPIAI